VLISGTFLLFNPPGGSTTKAVRSGDEAAKNATAPTDPNATPGASATPTAGASPTGTPGPQRQYTQAPPFTIDPSATYTATISTDKGDIVIQLDPKAAPQTVNDFVYLAQNHFYDGLSFQRVVPNLAAQAGAPRPDGTGGPGYTISSENSPLKHDEGSVATAEDALAPNTSGSQFYVALAALPSQNGKDTVFGKVTQGLEILKSLPARDPRSPNAAPPLGIKSITIDKQ